MQDAVNAIVGLSQTTAAVGQIYNIGSQEEVSILELAQRVKARAGSESDIRFVPYEQAYETGFEDFRRRVPSISKIQSMIEWEPTTQLDETIDQIIHYYREKMNDGGNLT